jgi:hypothetical protein
VTLLWTLLTVYALWLLCNTSTQILREKRDGKHAEISLMSAFLLAGTVATFATTSTISGIAIL